jgi:hypothetical protein
MGISMSIAATASKNPFGEAMSAHQTVASNTPTTAAATKFAEYLQEKQVASQIRGGTVSRAPTPEQLAKTLFGSSYDAKNQTIPLDKLAAEVRKQTAEFAEQLRLRLTGSGIDPNIPLDLSVGAGGRVIVDGGHPAAAEITKMFEDMPAIAQSYRDLATRNDQLAMQQIGAAYIREWNSAKSDAEKQASWNRYSTLMDKLSSMFNGRMTLGASTVVAESQQMLRRMEIA